MKFPNIFNKNKNLEETTVNQEESNSIQLNEEENVTIGTKIKIIAALLIVGFATTIAYWVQEPGQMKADVLSADSNTQVSESSSSDLNEEANSEKMTSVNTPSNPDERESSTESVDSTKDLSTIGSTMETRMVKADSTSKTQEVSIIDFAFTPSDLKVEKGTTVIWTNKDSVVHNVTSTNFKSSNLNPGESFTYTFSDSGEFDYSCSLHPQMTGKITVMKASADLIDLAIQSSKQTDLSAEKEEINSTDVTNNVELSNASQTSDREESSSVLSTSTKTDSLHGSAATQNTKDSQKLAKSGPEDFIYYVLFIGILLFTGRKSLFQSK